MRVLHAQWRRQLIVQNGRVAAYYRDMPHNRPHMGKLKGVIAMPQT